MLECLLAADGRPSRRGTARTGMGRSGRPVHQHREDHIGRLRAKLGEPQLIETVRETGYRIGGP